MNLGFFPLRNLYKSLFFILVPYLRSTWLLIDYSFNLRYHLFGFYFSQAGIIAPPAWFLSIYGAGTARQIKLYRIDRQLFPSHKSGIRMSSYITPAKFRLTKSSLISFIVLCISLSLRVSPPTSCEIRRIISVYRSLICF